MQFIRKHNSQIIGDFSTGSKVESGNATMIHERQHGSYRGDRQLEMGIGTDM